jgi:hypothetical protein
LCCDTPVNPIDRQKLKAGWHHKIGVDLKYQITGWLLFILCAMCFIASSLKTHDTLIFIGSVIFLLACIVFLIPLIGQNKKTDEDKL